MHERYIEPQKKWADLVLVPPFNENGLAALADRLWPLLATAALLPPWMHETFRAELLALLTPPDTAPEPTAEDLPLAPLCVP